MGHKNLVRTFGVSVVLVILVIVAHLASASLAQAASLTLGDAADNHVIQDTPDTNYGSSGKLWVTMKASKTESQPYFLFDLSSIPANATISSATFSFTALPNPVGTALNTSGVTLYQTATAGATFSETTETWNNRPAAGTATVNTGPINLSSSQASLAVSVNVASILRAGMKNTLIMRPQQPTGGWTMPIAAREYGTVAQRPSLSITYSVSSAPTVTNVNAANITSSSASLAASVNPQGTATKYHFEYGTTTSYGSNTPVPDADIGSGTTSMPVSQSLGSLSANTVYHYRIVATNLGGTTTSPDASFTTTSQSNAAPTVGTLSAGNVQSTTATLSAVINPNNLSTGYHFEYGMDLSDQSMVTNVPVPDGNAGSGSIGQAFTQNISGLSPGATYQWQVVATNADGATSSAIATFVTPQTSSDPVIAAAGDVACNDGSVTTTHCRQKAVSDLIVADPTITSVLGLGDLQYDCGSYSAYNDPQNYSGTWGRFKAMTYPAAGNHDYTFDSLDADCQGRTDPDPGTGYFQYFGNSATPLQPGCTQYCKGFYSFNKGNWHIINLNSCWAHYRDDAGIIRTDGCLLNTPQYTWLAQDLATVPASQCVLVYDHYPRWTDGAHGDTNDMNDMWNLMVANHVDVMLSGHDHDYESFKQIGSNAGGAQVNTATPNVNGVRQFVVGTGGAGHNPFGHTYHLSTGDNSSIAHDAVAFGFLRMALHTNSYDWNFVGDPAVSSFTDTGSGTCHN